MSAAVKSSNRSTPLAVRAASLSASHKPHAGEHRHLGPAASSAVHYQRGRGWHVLPEPDSFHSAPRPADFGAMGGTPVANGKSVLDQAWRSLGSNKPPDVVAILTRGNTPWGHAAVAYRPPGSNELMVMNIVNPEIADGAKLVNWLPLTDYLFGTTNGLLSEQGGAYNRAIDMVPIWNWPKEKIEKMHEYFVDLDRRQQRGVAHFELETGVMKNLVQHLKPAAKRHEYGNCVGWVSRGMKKAGIAPRVTMFPKKMLVDILETVGRRNPDDVDVVAVPWITNNHLIEPDNAPVLDAKVDLWSVFKNHRLKDLEDCAAARVVVDAGTTTAHVERRSRALSRI